MPKPALAWAKGKASRTKGKFPLFPPRCGRRVTGIAHTVGGIFASVRRLRPAQRIVALRPRVGRRHGEVPAKNPIKIGEIAEPAFVGDGTDGEPGAGRVAQAPPRQREPPVEKEVGESGLMNRKQPATDARGNAVPG